MKIRGTELAEAMVAAVDRLVSAREGTGALDRAIESIVGTIGRFGGKNATSYLEFYWSEMVMRDIPVNKRLSGFPPVVSPSIHVVLTSGFDEARLFYNRVTPPGYLPDPFFRAVRLFFP